VLPNHSYYSWYGSLDIVGEVWNKTNDNLTFVRISANFFDSSGRLIDTDYTYASFDPIAPGEKTCFSIFVWDEPEDWAYYEFEAPSYRTTQRRIANLTISNDSGSLRNDTFEIVGMVRNDDSSRVESIDVTGTLYNASGTVIDCDYAYLNNPDLDPGQTSAFEITFYGNDYSNATSYRLQAE